MAADRLALGEPLASQPGEMPCRLRLVLGDPARHPAVGEAEIVEGIEQPGRGRVGESQDGEHAQVLVAELRLDAAQERRVAQDGVEVRGDRRHGDPVAPGRDGAVQVGERLGIAERLGLRQDGRKQFQRAGRLGLEILELRVRVGFQGLTFGALVEQALRPALTVGRRQVEKRQVVATLVMGAIGAEGGVAFLVDEPGGGVGEARAGILVGGHALGLEEQRPAVAEALKHIVQTRGDGDELRLGGTVEVGTTVAQRALEGAVLVEDDAGPDEAGPRQVVAQTGGLLAVFGEVQHRSAPL